LSPDFLEHGMYLRQEADYGLKFSDSGAWGRHQNRGEAIRESFDHLEEEKKNEKSI